jgi:hypothetical protein
MYNLIEFKKYAYYTSKTFNSDHSLIPISYSKFKIFIVRNKIII